MSAQVCRRGFLAGSLSLFTLAGLRVSSSAHAQSRQRIRRLGFISMRSGPGEFDAAFREALRGLGYVEGRTIEIEYAWAAESDTRAEELAARLVSQHVDVIVAATTVAIRAAMRATTRISIYELEGFVAAGGLLSYGPSVVDMYRRAAGYVDRILKGANPAELPLEQPTVFRLAINVKAAQALGLTLTPTLLARADTLVR